MQVFLIILCRKIIFWLLSSPFPTLFLSFSYLQYNNKPKSQENASVLSKNLLKMLTKGGKKLATNSHLIFSTLHFSPLFSTTQNFAPYLILLFIFITSIGNKSFLNSQFRPENCSNRQELTFSITLQNSYLRTSSSSYRTTKFQRTSCSLWYN